MADDGDPGASRRIPWIPILVCTAVIRAVSNGSPNLSSMAADGVAGLTALPAAAYYRLGLMLAGVKASVGPGLVAATAAMLFLAACLALAWRRR
jgi:hypothetical protein